WASPCGVLVEPLDFCRFSGQQQYRTNVRILLCRWGGRSMNKPCCAIDVHTHVVPAELPDHVAAFGDIPWPSILHSDGCHAKVIIQGKNYRDIENACWDVPRRTQEMTGMDVGSQV